MEVLRCSGVEVQRWCRAAQVQKCRGAEVHWCSGVEVEVEELRCRDAAEMKTGR